VSVEFLLSRIALGRPGVFPTGTRLSSPRAAISRYRPAGNGVTRRGRAPGTQLHKQHSEPRRDLWHQSKGAGQGLKGRCTVAGAGARAYGLHGGDAGVRGGEAHERSGVDQVVAGPSATDRGGPAQPGQGGAVPTVSRHGASHRSRRPRGAFRPVAWGLERLHGQRQQRHPRRSGRSPAAGSGRLCWVLGARRTPWPSPNGPWPVARRAGWPRARKPSQRSRNSPGARGSWRHSVRGH
jgi:hypothetical protein